MRPPTLDVRVRDTAFDPHVTTKGKPRVLFYRQGESVYYKVWILLEGNDLPFVSAVTYTLHETFPDPVRRVERTVANPSCELVIWTWGIFDIRVEIQDRSGRLFELTHSMTYGRELEGDVEFVEREEALRPSSRPRPK